MNWREYEQRKRTLSKNLTSSEWEESIKRMLKELEDEQETTKNNE